MAQIKSYDIKTLVLTKPTQRGTILAKQKMIMNQTSPNQRQSSQILKNNPKAGLFLKLKKFIFQYKYSNLDRFLRNYFSCMN